MNLETTMSSSLSDPRQGTQAITKSKPPVNPRRAVLAGALGNLIEYYDYATYGILAVTLAPLFFPSNQPGVSILSALAVFGAAFVMRPLGGWFFGRLGDRTGRRRALILTVVTIGLASGAVGVLPTHAEAGTLAPVLLVLLRLIQGFSAGGEFAGSTTYIVETAPAKKRGLYLSAGALTIVGGNAVAATVVGLTASTMTAAQMASWGWRIPFLLSLPLALFGLWARLRLSESSEFEDMVERREIQRSPLLNVFKNHFGALVQVLCIGIAQAGFGFIGLIFLSVYLIGTRGFDQGSVYWLAAIAIAVGAVLCPLSGLLVDRFGGKVVLVSVNAAFVVLAWPMFYLLSGTTSFVLVGVVYVVFMILFGFYNPPTLFVASQLFPIPVRYTGIAMGINVSTVLAGATGPLTAQWLVHATGDLKAPAWWVIGVSLIGLIGALTLRQARSSAAAVTGVRPQEA